MESKVEAAMWVCPVEARASLGVAAGGDCGEAAATGGGASSWCSSIPVPPSPRSRNSCRACSCGVGSCSETSVQNFSIFLLGIVGDEDRASQNDIGSLGGDVDGDRDARDPGLESPPSSGDESTGCAGSGVAVAELSGSPRWSPAEPSSGVGAPGGLGVADAPRDGEAWSGAGSPSGGAGVTRAGGVGSTIRTGVRGWSGGACGGSGDAAGVQSGVGLMGRC
mmetsp:Transcript_19151/g.48581  ORF Transcript_19151/g.48581 Transcript_19151/m.48581 type:complete len:222 (+) Transcript_19151:762-1427(+)